MRFEAMKTPLYALFHMTSLLQCAMNELSNHDHSRFLTEPTEQQDVFPMDRKPRRMASTLGFCEEAVVVQMTWPGAPTVYYGDEAGVYWIHRS